MSRGRPLLTWKKLRKHFEPGEPMRAADLQALTELPRDTVYQQLHRAVGRGELVRLYMGSYVLAGTLEHTVHDAHRKVRARPQSSERPRLTSKPTCTSSTTTLNAQDAAFTGTDSSELSAQATTPPVIANVRARSAQRFPSTAGDGSRGAR